MTWHINRFTTTSARLHHLSWRTSSGWRAKCRLRRSTKQQCRVPWMCLADVCNSINISERNQRQQQQQQPPTGYLLRQQTQPFSLICRCKPSPARSALFRPVCAMSRMWVPHSDRFWIMMTHSSGIVLREKLSRLENVANQLWQWKTISPICRQRIVRTFRGN